MSTRKPARRLVDVASIREVPEGSRILVTVDSLTIGVFNIGGEYHALLNLCTHQLGPICEGQVTKTVVASSETDWLPTPCLEGRVIRCPWHRREFDIVTGQCIGDPRSRVRTYPTIIEADRIKVML